LKKIIIFLLMVGMIATFTACGDSSEPNPILEREPVLDFRSILDTELNVMFSLGDYRGDIEVMLGQPIGQSEIAGSVEYKTGLSVVYENYIAVRIIAHNLIYNADDRELETNRFEVLGLQARTTRDKISAVFGEDVFAHMEGFYSFRKVFNEFGDSTSREFAYVSSNVIWMEEPDWIVVAMSVAFAE